MKIQHVITGRTRQSGRCGQLQIFEKKGALFSKIIFWKTTTVTGLYGKWVNHHKLTKINIFLVLHTQRYLLVSLYLFGQRTLEIWSRVLKMRRTSRTFQCSDVSQICRLLSLSPKENCKVLFHCPKCAETSHSKIKQISTNS